MLPNHTFTLDETNFLLDGAPFVIRCGEVHYTRVAPENWTHRLKMCRAMGLNTVCVYLFWNFHEWQENEFNWEGWADVAKFCELAQAEGLWVILRPGPYSCAEWEMGGLPWWLLRSDDIQLRTSDPQFLAPATRFLREVGRVLAPLQITQGGPILMVQVENEYGSFGSDAEYMGAIREALLQGGFDVPLFACNPPGDIGKGFRDDLFQVVNFGPGAAKSSFETLRQWQPTGPQMNGEYYPAWFDTWGRPHHKSRSDAYLEDLGWMLENQISFSIYMAHGGTSFGLWAGADRPFLPDTSSYDYDAPISEAGHPTEKFWQTRELFARHLLPGETLPDPPANSPVIEIAPFDLTQNAPIFDNLPAPIASATPQHFEAFDLSRGAALYRTQIPAGEAAILSARAVHDFGWVFLDGEPVGAFDRRSSRYQISLPAREKGAQLDILVAAMGRVNFGLQVFDRKGLHAPVELRAIDFSEVSKGATELLDWQVFALPLDEAQLENLSFGEAKTGVPAFWRGEFELENVGDTWLDARSWGKGVVWVNGHCLGRFWNIGPTQTLMCPGVWLRTGRNEVVVLDWLGPERAQLAGLSAPILDQLRPELDFARPTRAGGVFSVTDIVPALEGTFESHARWQDAPFEAPVQGRFVCLESLDAHDEGPSASVAELDLLDETGRSLPKNFWKIWWADSEEMTAEDGSAENAIDGQAASFWHTGYSDQKPLHPHYLVVDLGQSSSVGGVRYLARQGDENAGGRVKAFRIYVSETPFGLTDDPTN